MHFANIQVTSQSKEKLVELVYLLIKNDLGGQATTKRIEKRMDETSRRKMRYVLRRLTREGKIKRVRGFGAKGIEYSYKTI
jgi:repressor of nif and glnA expression